MDDLSEGQIINHYPVNSCTEEFQCDYSHLAAGQISDYPPHHAKVGMDFYTCSNLCERLANHIGNIANPYRGVDVDGNWNRCYCLFDNQPACPDDVTCSAYPGDGSGPVSSSRGGPGTHPYPVTIGGGIVNLALHGIAWQSSTAHGGVASRAIDGNTNGDWGESPGVTHGPFL